MVKCGKQVQEGWTELAKKHGIDIHISGIYPLSHISFTAAPAELKTLFTQEMLRRGFIASDAYYASYAHKEEQMKKYLETVDEVFGIMAKAIKEGNYAELLEGPVAHGGFARLA